MNDQSSETRTEQKRPGLKPAEVIVEGWEFEDLSLGSKLLAAYRLGRNGSGLWLWHNVFWAMPEHESTWNGIPLSVEQIRRDRLILADVLHQNVFGELPRVLNELGHLAEVLVASWCEGGTYGGRDFGSRNVPGKEHWQELKILLVHKPADAVRFVEGGVRPDFPLGLAS